MGKIDWNKPVVRYFNMKPIAIIFTACFLLLMSLLFMASFAHADEAGNGVIAQGITLADKYAEKLTEVIQQYGPQTAQFALEVGRAASIQALLPGIIDLIIAIILIYISSIFWKKPLWNSTKPHDQHPTAFACSATALTVAGLSLMAIALGFLCNVYAWVGLFHPEVFLAAKALNL